MLICSLDLATSTGWALGLAGGKPTFGTIKMPKTGDDIGAYLLHFSKWFRPFLLEHKPHIVAFEAPLYLLHTGKKGQSRTQPATARKLFGLSNMVEVIVTREQERGLDVRCFEVHQQEWKKHFCGFGNFGKTRKPYPPIEACQERGWWVQNHDEADACAIFDYTAHIACPELARATDPLAMGVGW